MRKLIAFVLGILFAGNLYAANLPNGYTELEYIESTGTQYIDTGIGEQTGVFRITATLYASTVSNWRQLLGYSASSGGSPLGIWMQNNIKETFKGGNGNKIADGGKWETIDVTNPNSVTIPTFYINAVNPTLMSQYELDHAKFQNVKLYKDGTLIRNMIPAKDSRGTVGMYDTVEGRFYENKGSGTFTAGRELNPCRNLFNKADITIGKILNDTGAVVTQSNGYYSGHITVRPSTVYTVSQTNGVGIYLRILEYDSTNTMVKLNKGATDGTQTQTFTTDANTAYVIVSGSSNGGALDTIQLEQSSTATNYVPYSAACHPTSCKNLFDGVFTHFAYTPNEVLVNNSYQSIVLAVEPGQTYTLSRQVVKGNRFTLFFTQEYPAAGVHVYNVFTGGGNEKTYTFTVPQGMHYFVIYFDISGADISGMQVQIERGSTATEYVPYSASCGTCTGNLATYDSATGTVVQNGTPTPTNPITPIFYTQGKITLRRVGDVADSYDASTGKITRRVGVKVLDGTEGYTWNVSNDTFYSTERLTTILPSAARSNDIKIISTHLVGTDTVPGAGNRAGKIFMGTMGGEYKLFVGLASVATTSAEVNDYLAQQYAAGTPVTIWYPLATATEETVGQTWCETAIKIATTKYNTNAFSGVVTALSNAVDTIKTVVANTITQATAVANLHSGKQTKPTDTCPNGKICLLVEDEAGTPHWYEIIERAPGIVPAGSGYTQVEYLQMPAGAYINTNVVPTYNGHYEMDFATTTLSGTGGSTIGARNGGYPTGLLFGINNNNTFVFDGFSDTRYTSTDLLTNNTRYTYIWNNKVASLKQGNTVVATNTFTGTEVITAPLFLNGRNNNGTVAGSVENIYLYSFQAWNASGTMIADFVPARRNSDGVLGMYDTVSGNFFTNAGSGKFYAPDQYVPSAYTRLEYIEATGTQWIDTGLTTGKFVHDIAFTTVSNDNLMGNSAGAGWYWGQRRNASGNGYELATRYITGMNSTERRVVEYDNLDSAKILSAGGQTVTYSVSGAAGNNYILFRIYNSDQYYVNAKLWGFQAYDANGKIVRDMVPAKRNSDNEVGLYDNVNDVFYTNQGSGEFYAPGDRTLPAGYTKLQYIESTGTQEIDTGVLPSAVDDIYVRFKNTTTDAGYLIGAAGDGRYNYVGIHSAFSGYGENWGSGAQYTGFSVPADTSNIHVIKVDLTSAPKFYLDSTLKATQDAYATITSTYTLRVNANVSGNSQRCSARYYDVKLSKNGSLVRDFVPAQHGNDVGMYDLANGQFYKDAKGGNFTAGPVVQ